MNKTSVSFDGGKYTIEQVGHGSVDLLRYGRPRVTDAPRTLSAITFEVHVLRRLGAAAMRLRDGTMGPEAFDALLRELRSLTDFEQDLNNPGVV